MKDLIANFYEFWGGAYLGAFSDQMFDNDLYFPVALYSILLAIILIVTYYYVVDRPVTARLGVWALNILIGGILSAIIAYVSVNNDLTEIFASVGAPVPVSFSSDILTFALINAMWTVLLMFLFSLLLKWKSTNSSYVPF